MIKCLTIIQIELEFGIDCGRFLFSPAPFLLTHPSPLLCQISDVTFQLTGYRGRTELGKMFRIDYRRFLFSPPPSPNRSLHPTSPQCFVQPWCSLACSISPPGKRKGKRLLRRLLFSAKRICSQSAKDEKANRHVLVGYWMLRTQEMTDIYATSLCTMSPIVG